MKHKLEITFINLPWIDNEVLRQSVEEHITTYVKTINRMQGNQQGTCKIVWSETEN